MRIQRVMLELREECFFCIFTRLAAFLAPRSLQVCYGICILLLYALYPSRVIFKQGLKLPTRKGNISIVPGINRMGSLLAWQLKL